MLQAGPWAVKHSQLGGIVTESDLRSVHGVIAEHKVIGHNRQYHKIQSLMSFYILPEPGSITVLFHKDSFFQTGPQLFPKPGPAGINYLARYLSYSACLISIALSIFMFLIFSTNSGKFSRGSVPRMNFSLNSSR